MTLQCNSYKTSEYGIEIISIFPMQKDEILRVSFYKNFDLKLLSF